MQLVKLSSLGLLPHKPSDFPQNFPQQLLAFEQEVKKIL